MKCWGSEVWHSHGFWVMFAVLNECHSEMFVFLHSVTRMNVGILRFWNPLIRTTAAFYLHAVKETVARFRWLENIRRLVWSSETLELVCRNISMMHIWLEILPCVRGLQRCSVAAYLSDDWLVFLSSFIFLCVYYLPNTSDLFSARQPQTWVRLRSQMSQMWVRKQKFVFCLKNLSGFMNLHQTEGRKKFLLQTHRSEILCYFTFQTAEFRSL